jgi:hypothetical protein
MAQQTINIGTTANDGTGDPLRTAFDKVNDNFTELYNDDAGDVNSVNGATGVVVLDSDDISEGSTNLYNQTHTGDVTGSVALTIANDVVSYEKIDNEFTTSSTLTAGATVDVNFDSAQIFTLTPNQSTTLNVTNPKIGITKTLIVTGAGGSYTLAFTVGGVSGTFNLIAGEYDDTSLTKNLIQIICVSATEFWYSISQIAV